MDPVTRREFWIGVASNIVGTLILGLAIGLVVAGRRAR